MSRRSLAARARGGEAAATHLDAEPCVLLLRHLQLARRLRRRRRHTCQECPNGWDHQQAKGRDAIHEDRPAGAQLWLCSPPPSRRRAPSPPGTTSRRQHAHNTAPAGTETATRIAPVPAALPAPGLPRLFRSAPAWRASPARAAAHVSLALMSAARPAAQRQRLACTTASSSS
eukprot:3636458-Rhodomonas_salina.1